MRTPHLLEDEAVLAQVQDVRENLLRDAAENGVPAARVEEAITEALRDLDDCSVHSFIGVLVERDVRRALSLRAVPGRL